MGGHYRHGGRRRPVGGDLASGECFAAYVRSLNEGSLPWQRTHAGSYVRCWWWVGDDGEYAGRISVRPDLTPGVPHAGHIGYAVRPSRRRQGHATAMLAAALPVAFALGVDPVVLVCRQTNIGSAIVIERNGGRLLTTTPDGYRTTTSPQARRPTRQFLALAGDLTRRISVSTPGTDSGEVAQIVIGDGRGWLGWSWPIVNGPYLDRVSGPDIVGSDPPKVPGCGVQRPARDGFH